MNCDIYYDGECPFCTNFVQLSKLRENYSVRLMNLRDYPEKVKEFSEQGYDVDEGMAVVFDNKVYFGDEAVNFIGKFSNAETRWGRVYKFLFSHPVFVKKAYPYMRLIRNATLKLLGRKKLKACLDSTPNGS